MSEVEDRIASLRLDLARSKKDIVNHVTGLYSNNKENTRFDLKDDPFKELQYLQNDVTVILEQSKVRSEVRKSNEKEIQEYSSMIDVLQKISDISDNLMICEQTISKLSLRNAGKLIGDIEQSLRELPGPNTEIGGGQVCSILRKECKMLKNRLMSKTRRLMQDCIKFDYGRIVVNKQLKGMIRSEDVIIEDPIMMSEIWETIALMNKTEEIVDEMIRKLWLYVLRPLWKEKKPQSPHIVISSSSRSELIFENIARDQSKTFEEYLSSSNDRDGSSSASSHALQNPFGNLGMCRMSMSQLVGYLGHIFSFMHSEMLCANEEVVKCASMKLHAKPVSITTMLIDAVSLQLPKTESDLPSYRNNLLEPCKELEDILALFESGSVLPDNDNRSGGGGSGNDGQQKSKPTSSSNSKGTDPLSTVDNNSRQKQGVNRTLTDYLSNLSSTYADIRRREILERARELVLSDFHNTMLATGDAAEDEVSSAGDIGDPQALLEQSGSFAIQKLRFDSCQTSLAVCRLLKLVHEVMRQACSASPRVTNILFQSARDCLELFMAIVPMRFSDVIDTVPRMGAVFYNDCLYIAHNCTLISHKYHKDLGRIDPILLSTAGFADYIPRIRTMGDACMNRHLEEQQATLLELVTRIRLNPEGEVPPSPAGEKIEVQIRPGGLLRGGLELAGRLGTKLSSVLDTDAVAMDTVMNDEETAALVVRHLERLSSQWLGVLQEAVYCRLAGHLLEGVLQEVMKPLMASEFIAESSAIDITRVFRTLQRARLVFPDESKDDESLCRICASWRKFLALTDLLEYSLSEVAEWLPRKKFSSFTGLEMTCLIKALFDDSSRRHGILASILEMSS
jgi:hypothetical protein